jgi:hypothetical protein
MLPGGDRHPSATGLTEVGRLFRRHPAPPGWSLAFTKVMSATVGIIIVCVVLGRFVFGDTGHMFGERKLGTFASVAALAGAGVVSLKVHRRTRGTPSHGFWGPFGVLLCVVAADDLFRLHEQVDRWTHTLLGWDPNDPVTDHLDDVLVAGYLLPAVYLALRFRRQLLGQYLMVQVLSLAMACFGAMVWCDMFGHYKWVEEAWKLLAASLILVAFLAVYMQNVTPPADGEVAASPMMADSRT